MIEIEWDGVELAPQERQHLSERLRVFSKAVDPDGRARVQVEITGTSSAYGVAISGRNHQRRMGAEVRDRDLGVAIHRAIHLAVARWNAARRRIA